MHASQGRSMFQPSCPWCTGHRPGAAGMEGPGSRDLVGRVMLKLGGAISSALPWAARMRLFLKRAANLPRQSLGEAYCFPLGLPLHAGQRPLSLLASVTRRLALNSKTRGLATWRAKMPASGAEMHLQLKMRSNHMAAVDMQAMEKVLIPLFF